MQKLLIGIGLGAVLALGSCVLFVVLYSGPEPSVHVEAPTSASVDKPFTVRLVISNPHQEEITIDNVDIDAASLRSFHVEAISPQPTPESPSTDFGSHTWYFDRTLRPSSQESIEFTFRPQAAGIHQLPLEVCNSYQDCSRTLLSIRVDPPSP
jgi:hypothetical protein